MSIRILSIDDDHGDRKLLRRSLDDSGLDHEFLEAASFEAARREHGARDLDFVFLDNGLPEGQGVTLIARVQEIWGDVAVALVTGEGNEEIAAGAIKNGAVDYIAKRRISGPVLAQVVEKGVKLVRLRAEVASQNEALKTFAHVLAHDLKSPLTAVRFLAEAVLHGVEEHDEDEIRENAQSLLDYAARLTELITSLEQYNVLGRPAEQSVVDGNDVLAGALAVLDHDIRRTGARVVTEPLPMLRCNAMEVSRLFQNLISNAIKYRSEAAPEIRVGWRADPGSGLCVVSVADNGIGIPEDKRETIFEAFRRLHSHSKIPGTGLGLAMCRKIVEQHGGRIWCEPGGQGGTVFRFELPLAARVEADLPGRAAVPGRGGSVFRQEPARPA